MSAPHMDQASPGGHHSVTTTSKLVGPGHAETVHASEKFDKTGLLAAHLAELHDAYMLERGLLPGTSLPDTEAPPIPPVYADSPWKDFKPLRLAEMKIGKTHRRHVLEGRLCAKSLKVTSVVNVLEQDSGLATKLILTNALPVRASMAQAQNCYPEGSRVTVRDPYLTRLPDGVVGVLVERPNDIAFLSRPEDTGDHLVYGAVGLEDEREGNHHTPSRDQEDFSRKIHLFEQQMKQEQLAQLESLDSRRLSGMFQRPVAHGAAHHREDASAHARSSPPKAEAKETQSPAKEEPKDVIRATNNTAEESAASTPVDRLQDSPPLPQGGIVEDAQEELTPSPVVVVEEEPSHLEATRVAVTGDPVEEPTTFKAEERRGVKDVETPEEESLESVPTVLSSPKSLELSREATPSQDVVAAAEEVAERSEVVTAEEVAERPEVAANEEVAEQLEVAADEEVAESEKATMEPIAEESVSRKQEDASEEQLETLGNGKTLAPESMRPPTRKQFQRSDSLVTVQEVEDSKAARALGTTEVAAASSRGEFTKETLTPEHKEEVVTVPPTSDAPESHPPESQSHSANDLRVLGNLMFGEENFQGAADQYTRSIRIAESEEQQEGKPVCNSEIILGYSNRAEAYIRLQAFDKALADAKKALSRDPSHLKSLFRKGRALLGLSQYEQALTTLQAAAPRAPTDRDLQAALHDSSTGVQQSRHGHYDLAHYYLKGKQLGESPFSADYVGPVMATDVGRGRGRGLVLTRDVEAGELLLVSNPMAFLPLTDPTRHEISQAFVDGKVQEGFRHLFEAAHHKGLEKMSTLHDGEKVLPAPSVTLTDAESGPHEVLLDHARVRRIIQLNAINGDATMGWKNLPGSGEQDKKVEHWGLWWLPSFINHSCLPSSSPVLVGKALFVFAARDLRAGDEVTRAYFDIFQPLDQRKELSTKGWGFVCYCRRCKLEDALHTSLSKVTEQYTKLMELASKSKSEFGTDEQLSETQASAALRFFHKLESKLKDFKLNGAENNWVRASFLHYIDMISGDHELHTHLESIVDALAAVCPGSETTLHMAVVAKDSARRTFGKKSVQFKAANQRALNICRFTYGKQKASVLQAIVDRNEYQS